jgi:NADPH2:quinone reductase
VVARALEVFDRIVLVYNPANPRIPLTLAESVRDDLCRQLPDMPVTFQPTRYPGHARELAHAAAGTGRPLIIAVSGDGVYNEVVNGIMDVDGSSAVSAVAAGGNANDHRRGTRRMPLIAAIVDEKNDGGLVRMKSVVYSRTGDPSVLRLVDRDVAEPGPGEVRVRILVSGVNPTDWKSRRGSGDGAAPPFPEVTPNQDGSGLVDALGEGAVDLAAGDRVWVYLAGHQRPTGTAQEYTNVPADRVVKLPPDTSFDIGASLGVPAMTAHRALTVSEDGPERLYPGALAGKVVLVAGGAGAVGHAAIQLARWAGATVVTTISSAAKAALAVAAGAHHVINYRDEDVATAIRKVAHDGVDLVVEVAIAANAQLNLDVVKPRSSVAIYANDGGREFTLDVRQNMIKNLRYQFVLLYTVGDAALKAAVDDITLALVDEALPVGENAGLPLHRFPLANTADAHQAVQDSAVGKVLIDVSAAD